MCLRRHHARVAAQERRWHWAWRRLHVLAKCMRVTLHGKACDYGTTETWNIDASYCLDRYLVGDEL